MLWTFDSEADGLVDEMTRFHCFVFKPYKHRVFHIFADRDRWDDRIKGIIESNYTNYQFYWGFIEDVVGFLRRDDVTMLSVHNGFGFDLEAMKKMLGVDYSISSNSSEELPDRVNGKPVYIIDTLAVSRCLQPDREMPAGCPTRVYNPVTDEWDTIGPHGFAAWGYRVAKAKPAIHDWKNDALVNYINRCVEDVGIGERVWDALKVEASDKAIGSNGWKDALRMSRRAFFDFCEQERTGAVIDVDKAQKLLTRIDAEMDEIESEVNEMFVANGVMRTLPESQQPNYPKTTFKKDGNIAVHAFNWCVKMGIPEESMKDVLMDINREISIGNGDAALAKYVLKEPVTIKNQDAIKEYLYNNGWSPTMWRMKNLMVEQKTKKPYAEQKTNELIAEYIQEVKESLYREDILEELGWTGGRSPESLSTETFRKFVKENARSLPSTPQIRDTFGKICENLEELDGDLAKKIVRWLSLRNRRNVILSEKGTGWLAHPRLKVDGRIPARQSGTTNTHRWKHSVIVNVPKPEPKVVLGYEMRDLFCAPKGYLCIGWDSSALENRVAGHYAAEFDGGAYAETLMHGDSHKVNAANYSVAAAKEITRSKGKNVTYGVMYGAQKHKVAKMLDISPDRGQAVIDSYWDGNPGLKQAKEKLEDYWMRTGKKYIMGIDGRKIYTRSKHSLLNALFQSTGAILMDYSGALCSDIGRSEGLVFHRWGYYHDEYQYYFPITNDKSIFTWHIHDNEDEPAPDDRLWTKIHKVKEGKFAGKFIRYYHRFGEICVQSHIQVGRQFGMRIELGAEYMIGRSWAETH